LQLQGKPANDVEGTSKVSIESQPNLYHSTPFLVKNEQSTESISKSSPSQIAILIFFWQKQKKPSPTVPHLKLPFMPSSEKRASARVYMRARIRGASVRIIRGGRTQK